MVCANIAEHFEGNEGRIWQICRVMLAFCGFGAQSWCVDCRTCGHPAGLYPEGDDLIGALVAHGGYLAVYQPQVVEVVARSGVGCVGGDAEGRGIGGGNTVAREEGVQLFAGCRTVQFQGFGIRVEAEFAEYEEFFRHCSGS